MSKKVKIPSVQACCAFTQWRIASETGVGDETVLTVSFTSSMVMKARPSKKQLDKMALKITELLKIVEIK